MEKILIVEDEIDTYRLLKYRLEVEGQYQTIQAKDGVEALEKVRTEKPDLVILDIMLPVLDGYEVCRTLKNDASTKQIPIIMLTAKGTIGNMEEGIRAGTDDYVTKPYDSHQLLDKIKKLLQNKGK